MLKVLRIVCIVTFVIAGVCPQAFGQGKNVGLGIMLGEPTGFSVKVWRDLNTAVDGGIAWSLTDEKHFNVHTDMLWHNWDVLNDAFELDTAGTLPLYYGVGGRLKSEDDTRIGIRFVVGSAFEFSNAPFDIFFEIVPVMDIVPKTELDLNVAIGSRFWFF